KRGRLWSARFGVGFVRPAGERLVRVVARRAEIVPTTHEMVELRRQAERRAEQARHSADQQVRRADESVLQAEEAVRQRMAAEQRVADLSTEVERLRRLLNDRNRSPSDS